MRELRTAVEVQASAEEVWAVLTDVTRWPEWTPSVQSIELLTGPVSGVGSKARIHQPKLRPAVWTVTTWEAGRRFRWTATSPGVAVMADHVITKTPSGCTVTLGLRVTGVLGTVIGLIGRRLAFRYLQMEAAGLKARCEQASAVEAPLSVKSAT